MPRDTRLCLDLGSFRGQSKIQGHTYEKSQWNVHHQHHDKKCLYRAEDVGDERLGDDAQDAPVSTDGRIG